MKSNRVLSGVFSRFTDQQRVLTGFALRQGCVRTSAPLGIGEGGEARFFQTAMEFLAIVQPEVAPRTKGDVHHLSTGLDVGKLRPVQPVLIAPVTVGRFLHEYIQRWHRNPHHTPGLQGPSAFPHQRQTVFDRKVFQNVFGVNVFAGVVTHRQRIAEIPRQVGR